MRKVFYLFPGVSHLMLANCPAVRFPTLTTSWKWIYNFLWVLIIARQSYWFDCRYVSAHNIKRVYRQDANCSAPQGCGDVRPSRIIKALRHVYQIKACPPLRDLAVPMNCSFTYLCTTAPGSLTWYRTNQIARFDSCITDSTQEA